MFYIYVLTNTINGKVYIGQTKQHGWRLRQHTYNSKNGQFGYKGLLEDMRKHPFKGEIIGCCETRREALQEEALMIFKFDSHIKGYNAQLHEKYLGGWVRKRKRMVWIDNISKFEQVGYKYTPIEMTGLCETSLKLSFNLY